MSLEEEKKIKNEAVKKLRATRIKIKTSLEKLRNAHELSDAQKSLPKSGYNNVHLNKMQAATSMALKFAIAAVTTRLDDKFARYELVEMLEIGKAIQSVGEFANAGIQFVSLKSDESSRELQAFKIAASGVLSGGKALQDLAAALIEGTVPSNRSIAEAVDMFLDDPEDSTILLNEIVLTVMRLERPMVEGFYHLDQKIIQQRLPALKYIERLGDQVVDLRNAELKSGKMLYTQGLAIALDFIQKDFTRESLLTNHQRIYYVKTLTVCLNNFIKNSVANNLSVLADSEFDTRLMHDISAVLTYAVLYYKYKYPRAFCGQNYLPILQKVQNELALSREMVAHIQMQKDKQPLKRMLDVADKEHHYANIDAQIDNIKKTIIFLKSFPVERSDKTHECLEDPDTQTLVQLFRENRAQILQKWVDRKRSEKDDRAHADKVKLQASTQRVNDSDPKILDLEDCKNPDAFESKQSKHSKPQAPANTSSWLTPIANLGSSISSAFSTGYNNFWQVLKLPAVPMADAQPVQRSPVMDAVSKAPVLAALQLTSILAMKWGKERDERRNKSRPLTEAESLELAILEVKLSRSAAKLAPLKHALLTCKPNERPDIEDFCKNTDYLIRSNTSAIEVALQTGTIGDLTLRKIGYREELLEKRMNWAPSAYPEIYSAYLPDNAPQTEQKDLGHQNTLGKYLKPQKGAEPHAKIKRSESTLVSPFTECKQDFIWEQEPKQLIEKRQQTSSIKRSKPALLTQFTAKKQGFVCGEDPWKQQAWGYQSPAPRMLLNNRFPQIDLDGRLVWR